jgi:integrase
MAPKIIKRGLTKGERKCNREEIGALADKIIKPETRERYSKAVRCFFAYLDDRNITLPSSAIALDSLLVDYIGILWEEGDTKAWAGDLLSGLGTLEPSLKKEGFPRGWQMFTAWGKHEMPVRATPFTVEEAMALAGLSLERGDKRMAATILVGFHGLLRTGELRSLRKDSLVFAASCESCVIKLGYTKGGQRRGVQEEVCINDPFVSRLLFLASEKDKPGDSLLKRTEPVFRSDFNLLLKHFGLLTMGFKPYSLRRGGATHLFRETASFDAVAERGRWAHLKTCRIYVNEATASLDRCLSKTASRNVSRSVLYLQSLM